MYEAKVPPPSDPPADRRVAKRHMAVLLLVKINVDGREALARISNLSRTGARIETSLPLSAGSAIRIELRSDVSADAVIRWINGQEAGVEFTKPIDVDRFLSRKISSLSRKKPRPPRYVCDALAQVTTEDGVFSAALLDLSISGAGLSCETDWKAGDIIVLAIEGLKPRRARVAWTRDGVAGIEFMLPLNYREFDVWLANGGGRPQKD